MVNTLKPNERGQLVSYPCIIRALLTELQDGNDPNYGCDPGGLAKYSDSVREEQLN